MLLACTTLLFTYVYHPPKEITVSVIVFARHNYFQNNVTTCSLNALLNLKKNVIIQKSVVLDILLISDHLSKQYFILALLISFLKRT